MLLRHATRFLLPDQVKGYLDYYRFPQRRDSWGGAFNGQARRQEQFISILQSLGPKAIVETGTYRGTTTAYLAQAGLPVYTVEGHARNYGFARRHLLHYKNVVMFKSDSRVGLRRILETALREKLQDSLFFYLDAHWNDDLPLAQELNIILSACVRPVVMIDDFQVPGDAGYAFDDYGGTNVLKAEYIASSVERYGLSRLYPSAPSERETGAKRGSVVLCGEADAAVLLETALFRLDLTAKA
jgi:hypothetical protein